MLKFSRRSDIGSTAIVSGPMPAAKRPRFQRHMTSLTLLLMGAPSLLLLLVFNYLPMGGIVIAFKDFRFNKGLWGSDWVGLKNFEFFFTSESAWRVTRNALLLNAAFIITGTVLSVALALMLFEMGRRAVKVYQTVFFFPYFLSWVVVSYAAYALLSSDFGAINGLLTSLGLEPVIWYSEPKYWVAILIIANFWKNGGYSMLLYYTNLTSVDVSLYEAAAIDGANGMQKVRHISLPMLTPLVVMLTLLSIGRIFYSDFGMFFFLPRNSGALYPVTDVIDTYVYRALRLSGEIGMAAASGFYQSVVGFVLILASNLLVKRINPENAIF